MRLLIASAMTRLASDRWAQATARVLSHNWKAMSVSRTWDRLADDVLIALCRCKHGRDRCRDLLTVSAMASHAVLVERGRGGPIDEVGELGPVEGLKLHLHAEQARHQARRDVGVDLRERARLAAEVTVEVDEVPMENKLQQGKHRIRSLPGARERLLEDRQNVFDAMYHIKKQPRK